MPAIPVNLVAGDEVLNGHLLVLFTLLENVFIG
jgi:hypothetical protein